VLGAPLVAGSKPTKLRHAHHTWNLASGAVLQRQQLAISQQGPL